MINRSKHNDEHLFLEGPQSRRKELAFLFKVFVEFFKGIRKFHFLGPCATVFGSARFHEDHPHYQLAQKMGAELSRLGFTIMTGGGPGIMEAANRGAKQAGGRSVGCNIVLPVEQVPNKYLDKWVRMDYFFIRKVLLSKYSFAFVVMPGGYGTLDEFFESLTLIQTHKAKPFPVVLMGKEFHKELFEHISLMQQQQTISKEDSDIFLFTDSIEEASGHIEKYAINKFGLRQKKKIIPWKILGEK